MAEIDVEAVDQVGVDAPAFVLYGGKGGVGKTTMAAATGLASAAAGVATLVVSTDPAHSLSDTFETDVTGDPERIRDDAPLWAVEIDPAAADASVIGGDDGSFGLGGLGELGGFGELLGDGAPDGAPSGGPMPGADEAAALQQLLRFLDDDRFERVVVDTAPTGHTLRLLELPDAMNAMVGRLLAVRERLGEAMGQVTGLFGDDGADPGADLADLRELRDRVERLRAALRDPTRTDFRVVLVPETMSVAESTRLVDRLESAGVPVGTVVVNRVLEPPSAVVGDDVAFEAPDLDDCAFCKRRWRVQQEALGDAQDLFRRYDVRRVPLLADEVRGEAALRAVAACLAT